MSDAMDDEFDTVAQWTADAVLELGSDYAVPAGCRGSGGPAALTWLLDQLQVTAQDRMLDCGAGVGGPAAYAAQNTGVCPVLVEPEPGACQAAERLFGLTAIVATGQQLPFDDGSFDVIWCLAVLCTSNEQVELLAELRRVLDPIGRLGLLVYVRTTDDLRGGPEGNVFPTIVQLDELVANAGLLITARQHANDLGADPKDWKRRADAVDELLTRRHGNDKAWRTAQRQSEAFGALLSSDRVHGLLLALRPR